MSASKGEAAAAPMSPGKGDGMATKREYVAFLVTQDKFTQAEEVRNTRKAMEQRMQERDRRHKATGLGRQQAATAQMKKASEAVEEHREHNLAKGRAVATETSQWEVGAKEQKDKWVEHAKQMKQAVKEADGTAAAVAELSKKKKDAAAATRRDDADKEKMLEDLREQWKKTSTDNVQKIKEDTGDKAVDEAKRFFYEQRKALAIETKEASAKNDKERAAEKATFDKLQAAKRAKAKAMRDDAGKSRTQLKTARAEAAAKAREAKQLLMEQIAANKKANEEKKLAQKAAVVASVAYDPNTAPAWPKAASPTGAA